MNQTARISIITDSVSQAQALQAVLREEFEHVSISSTMERIAREFDALRPDVLVFLFSAITTGTDYLLELLRRANVLQHSFRTVLLCREEEASAAYQLCRERRFDDYLIFANPTRDGTRALWALHQALEQIAVRDELVFGQRQLVARAKHLSGLDDVLEQAAARCTADLDKAARALQQVGQEIAAALHRFGAKLASGGEGEPVVVKDAARLKAEIAQLTTQAVSMPLRSTVIEALLPLRTWSEVLLDKITGYTIAARELKKLVKQVRPCILLVDDDEFQHKLLARLLPAAEYKLVTVASGALTFAVVRMQKPDLILLDVSLPDLDGVEVAKRLRAAQGYADIPIIMVTGHAEEKLVVECLSAGANDFLVKPLERDALLVKIRKLLTQT
jgi:DNA-binding response OmpR family regulator